MSDRVALTDMVDVDVSGLRAHEGDEGFVVLHFATRDIDGGDPTWGLELYVDLPNAEAFLAELSNAVDEASK